MPQIKRQIRVYSSLAVLHRLQRHAGKILDHAIPAQGHRNHDAAGPLILADRFEKRRHAGADDGQPVGPGNQRYPGNHALPGLPVFTKKAGAVQGQQGFGPARAGRRHISARKHGQGRGHHSVVSQQSALNRDSIDERRYNERQRHPSEISRLHPLDFRIYRRPPILFRQTHIGNRTGNKVHGLPAYQFGLMFQTKRT